MRKLITLLITFRTSTIILLALASWASGCARQPASPEKPRIALIMKSLANEFFQTMENGAKAHQRENAGEYDLIANGTKDEQDVSRQIDLVEQMIAQRVAAIVIAPADSKALITVCKRALDAGIPVINIDNKFDASVLADKGVKIPFVGPDNRKGARLAGEYLAKRLKPGDKVAIIEGVPNAFNGVQRRLGFEDAMKSWQIEIATSQSGYWETARANQVASSIITEQPDLKAVLCANDNMALGAVAALRAAGKSKDILVIGFDNISAVQQLIRDKQILATVDQHADLLAVYGIEYALQIIKSKDAPADRETPVDLITAENLK
jgi:ribose transport system substrate-binding protein